MKKIGIVTLTKNANYGNVLQNIALQIALRNLGCNAETIINLTDSTLFKKEHLSLKKIIKWLINYNDYRIQEKRNNVFRKCCQEKINYSSITYDETGFSGKLPDYDYVIAGSDQIWNPTFGFASDFEFLEFVPENRRISYAASFGVDTLEMLSQERRNSIGRSLSQFSYLSVREKSGKQIADSFPKVHTEVHIDPTMLLTGQEWRKIARKPGYKVPDKYILVYMLGNITHEYQERIHELAKYKKAHVINALEGKNRFIDPLQFIWLIDNAELICTDSFHASVFSILFHSRFYIFNRKDSHADQSSRFTSLLYLSGIPEEFVLYKNTISYEDIEWEKVDQKLLQERQRSLNYLKIAISSDNRPLKRIEILEKKNCCGCGSCEQACPKRAIQMVSDIGGFPYPFINKVMCIDCGICRKVCPIVQAKPGKEKVLTAYAAYSKDESIRMCSSSGGIFSVIATYVIEKNGVVFGAALDNNQVVRHIGITKIEDLKKLRGSKYVQSSIEHTYTEVQEALKKDLLVLFTGTACQISGLKSFLGKEYVNLFTVDVLCHGVPAPRLWKHYIDERKNDYKSTVRQTFFRQKNFGWKMFAVEIQFENSMTYIKKFTEDPFMRLFLSNICLRDSCYSCKFKTLERDSDLTIGDAWGIQNLCPDMDDDKGTSIILVHTKKGEEIVSKIWNKIVVKKFMVDALLPLSSDSRKSVLPHPKRNEFFREMDAGVNCEELLFLLNKNISLMSRIKYKIRKLITEFHVM